MLWSWIYPCPAEPPANFYPWSSCSGSVNCARLTNSTPSAACIGERSDTCSKSCEVPRTTIARAVCRERPEQGFGCGEPPQPHDLSASQHIAPSYPRDQPSTIRLSLWHESPIAWLTVTFLSSPLLTSDATQSMNKQTPMHPWWNWPNTNHPISHFESLHDTHNEGGGIYRKCQRMALAEPAMRLHSFPTQCPMRVWRIRHQGRSGKKVDETADETADVKARGTRGAR